MDSYRKCLGQLAAAILPQPTFYSQLAAAKTLQNNSPWPTRCHGDKIYANIEEMVGQNNF